MRLAYFLELNENIMELVLFQININYAVINWTTYTSINFFLLK